MNSVFLLNFNFQKVIRLKLIITIVTMSYFILIINDIFMMINLMSITINITNFIFVNFIVIIAFKILKKIILLF